LVEGPLLGAELSQFQFGGRITAPRFRLRDIELLLIWGAKQSDYDIALPLSDFVAEPAQPSHQSVQNPQMPTSETKAPPSHT
jgi:hypothetical protein